ncbi:potassium channel subfamily K member 5-like [Asterias rubens]|uniref:potassium channel subfamily K member 5-like n=1 Tax=Asterias rubens TaxID=7604 RepID=UPI0014556ED8|nr:potassium channel subfamily K member 5-like [Asterias rubens]
MAIEREADDAETKLSRRELYRALQNFSEENRECNATTENLRGLMEQAEIAWKLRRVFRTDTDTTKGIEPVWNIADSMGFALSILTTCGYGELVPITKTGQLICIIYAAVGIPLCYYMILTVGKTFRDLWFAMLSSSCQRYKIPRRISYFLVPVIALWIVLVVFPSLVLIQTEGWPLLTALYFSVMSLSTIGFGDVMPRRPNPYSAFSNTMKLIFIFYILLCLSVMSITFACIARVLKEFKSKRRRKQQDASQRRNTLETNIDFDEEVEPYRVCNGDSPVSSTGSDS